ncbi:histone-lysine N-methyltransferase ASHH2-like isoform X1 [Cornus florida]|uniref:histone-lysine N-methyltransferase ASHH2-like isoform X1 n=1 Tax=Cornus florida TaxID=4283 RepID=UPI00289939B0|nr:histone-lysine N-methyltransferase ASHH2-like isoform X1 [Cornus florida]
METPYIGVWKLRFHRAIQFIGVCYVVGGTTYGFGLVWFCSPEVTKVKLHCYLLLAENCRVQSGKSTISTKPRTMKLRSSHDDHPVSSKTYVRLRFIFFRFRESILTLTEHDDKQVHQIALSFRDKWFPRQRAKFSCMEMDDSGMEFHRGLSCNRFSESHTHGRDQGVRPIKTTDCIKPSTIPTTPVDSDTPGSFSASCSSGCTTNVTKMLKRKSRWDQPAETNPLTSPERQEPKTQPNLFKNSYSSTKPEGDEVGLGHTEGRSKEGQTSPSYVHNFPRPLEADRADERQQNIDEDVPPGFSLPLNRRLVSSNASTGIDLHGDEVRHAKCPVEVVMGYPQGRFNSRRSVSYGILLSVVQQFGTPHEETVEGWVIAPGMPFQPFPPLPPYPRDKRETPACAATMTMSRPAEKVEQESRDPATFPSDQGTPTTSGASSPYMDIQGANILHNSQRVRDSNSLGTKNFRQQKWNNSKLGPPWLRKRNGWGSTGNNSRSGMCGIGVGTIGNEFKSPNTPYSSEYVGTAVESPYSTFQRHPQHQN